MLPIFQFTYGPDGSGHGETVWRLLLLGRWWTIWRRSFVASRHDAPITIAPGESPHPGWWEIR